MRLSNTNSAYLGRVAAFGLGLLLTPFAAFAQSNDDVHELPVCVYISSYHQGFEWSDGIQTGLYDVLEGSCRIVQFDMDTKREQSSEHLEMVVSQVKELVDREQPDVIITSDDSAARHVIVPFLANTETPVIFTGVNWTVEEYGFPLPNVTGMVEVAPIKPMFNEARKYMPNAKRAMYLGPSTLSEGKNYDRYKRAGDSMGIEVSAVLVESFEKWKSAFVEAQAYDFVIIGSHSGIPDWSAEEAESHALSVTTTLSLTTHDWMMPVTSMGFTTLPEEQGEWAGSTTLAVLDGVSPESIPIVTNRKWDTWVNQSLLEATGVTVEEALFVRAKIHKPKHKGQDCRSI